MLSKRVQSLKPSPTLALAAKAGELRSQGEDVISLSVGEPDWDTFDSIKQAGITAIQQGKTKYAPSAGLPELREAIAEQTSKDLGVQFSPSEVTVSTGGKFIIYSALQCLIDPGHEVLIPAPYWVSYPTMVELAGGQPVIVSCGEESGFRLTPEALRGCINDSSRLLILNTPSNPTGLMYSESELLALGAVLEEHPRLLVLSDDIYNRLVFNDSGLAPHLLQACPRLKDRCVIVNGLSKTYSMTGWRMGWAIGPQELIQAMNRLQSQSVSCASPFTQLAGLAAIQGGEGELKSSLEHLHKRKDFVVKALGSLPDVKVHEPHGAFYVWTDISAYLGRSFKGQKLSHSREFAQALLEDQKLVVVPGQEFGLDGYLRISYAIEEARMAQAVERLGAFLAEVQ